MSVISASAPHCEVMSQTCRSSTRSLQWQPCRSHCCWGISSPPGPHNWAFSLSLRKTGAHLQRGHHALFHVFRLEELSKDALVAARVLRERGGELVLDLEEEALCGLVGRHTDTRTASGSP